MKPGTLHYAVDLHHYLNIHVSLLTQKVILLDTDLTPGT